METQEIGLNGNEFVSKIADRLNATGALPHDSNIILELKQLTIWELFLLVNTGDIPRWHNEQLKQSKTGL